MTEDELNDRLSSIVKKFVETETSIFLSTKKYLPKNFDRVEVDVFESAYGRICNIYFIFKNPYNSDEYNQISDLSHKIKNNIKSSFHDMFKGGIYRSFEISETFKPRRMFR